MKMFFLSLHKLYIFYLCIIDVRNMNEKIERKELEEAVFDLFIIDLHRFAEKLLKDIIMHEVLDYTRVEIWARKNISKEEIDEVVSDILKNERLVERFNREYRECVEASKDSDFCKRYAIVSIAREYFRKKLYSKVLNLSKKYLKDILPQLI